MKLHWTFNANVNYQFTLIISEIMKTPLIFVINQSRWEKLPMPEAVSAETETDEDFIRPWEGIADKDRTLAAEWELVVTNWKSTTDHCTWYGVTCDHLTDRVINRFGIPQNCDIVPQSFLKLFQSNCESSKLCPFLTVSFSLYKY